MAANTKHRAWYLIYKVGNTEPIYFVSAISESSVHTWTGRLGKQYRVVPAKLWYLMKVFSGNPAALGHLYESAPNCWAMNCEENKVMVVILD